MFSYSCVLPNGWRPCERRNHFSIANLKTRHRDARFQNHPSRDRPARALGLTGAWSAITDDRCEVPIEPSVDASRSAAMRATSFPADRLKSAASRRQALSTDANDLFPCHRFAGRRPLCPEWRGRCGCSNNGQRGNGTAGRLAPGAATGSWITTAASVARSHPSSFVNRVPIRSRSAPSRARGRSVEPSQQSPCLVPGKDKTSAQVTDANGANSRVPCSCRDAPISEAR
jgi:hypothetical protein